MHNAQIKAIKRKTRVISLNVIRTENVLQWTPLNTPTLGPGQLGVISGVGVLTGGIYCTVSNTLGPRKLGVLSGWAYYPRAY